jgi:short-subunit dehydrogenase
MKTAIVTGGGSGIGLEISKRLIKRGYKVYAFTLTEPEDKEINFIYCDVSKKEIVEKAFAEFYAAESRVDLLVNNAGFGISGAVEFNTELEIRQQIDVNFFGAVWCSQNVIAKMREQHFGKIIFIGSVGAVFTLPFQTFYSVSKVALQYFAEGLYIENKPFGIQTSTFLLGDIKSGFTKNRKKNEQGAEFYGTRIERSVAVMEQDEQHGMSPEVVAKRVVKAIDRRRMPRLRVIGVKYKIFCLLNKILPRRFVLFLIDKIYG